MIGEIGRRGRVIKDREVRGFDPIIDLFPRWVRALARRVPRWVVGIEIPKDKKQTVGRQQGRGKGVDPSILRGCSDRRGIKVKKSIGEGRREMDRNRKVVRIRVRSREISRGVPAMGETLPHQSKNSTSRVIGSISCKATKSSAVGPVNKIARDRERELGLQMGLLDQKKIHRVREQVLSELIHARANSIRIPLQNRKGAGKKTRANKRGRRGRSGRGLGRKKKRVGRRQGKSRGRVSGNRRRGRRQRGRNKRGSRGRGRSRGR